MLVFHYVDKLMIAENSLQFVVEIKNALCFRFKMEGWEKANICLGIEIAEKRLTLTLNKGQENYVS